MCSVVLIISAYEGLIDHSFEVTFVYSEVNPVFVWSIPTGGQHVLSDLLDEKCGLLMLKQ
jgi:hypothetical protein